MIEKSHQIVTIEHIVYYFGYCPEATARTENKGRNLDSWRSAYGSICYLVAAYFHVLHKRSPTLLAMETVPIFMLVATSSMRQHLVSAEK